MSGARTTAPGGPRRTSPRDVTGARSRARPPALIRAAAALFGALVLALLAVPAVPGLTAPAAAAARPRAVPGDASPPTLGALYEDGPDDRWLLGGTWLYRADPTNVGLADGYEALTPSTEGWTPTTVPNSWNAGDFSPASQYGAVGWYRRDLTLPARAFPRYVPERFRSWVVRFESVNDSATVWLNGREIGSHAGAYVPWELPLRGLRAGVNELVVRVSSIRNAGSLPPGPGGGWWNFGGIQREVYLRSIAEVDMSPVVVRPILACPTCAATIEDQVTVNNPTDSPQTVSLSGTYGSAGRLRFGGRTIPAHGTWVAEARLRIPHPHLWSTDDPHLYAATVTAADAQGRTLQTYSTQSGIRLIQVSADGQLLLNGRALDLRGFSIHEQNISDGAALTPAQLDALVGFDQALGGTILREHYPFNPQIEEAADRDGILLWSEIPVYQTKTQYLARPGWLAAAHGYLRDEIENDENHPSILLWSIGNELSQPANDNEARYIAGAAQLAHQLDPTRPVGMATLGWPGAGCQAAYAPLDVVGFNDYFDWFDPDGGTADSLSALSPYLDSLHACYPSKALMVTEWGFEGSRNGPIEVKGTYQDQAWLAQQTLSILASKPYLAGAIYFPLQYFAAFPGWTGGDPLGDPPFVQKGPIDLYGNAVQPIAGVLSASYHATQQIAPPLTAAARRR